MILPFKHKALEGYAMFYLDVLLSTLSEQFVQEACLDDLSWDGETQLKDSLNVSYAK